MDALANLALLIADLYGQLKVLQQEKAYLEEEKTTLAEIVERLSGKGGGE